MPPNEFPLSEAGLLTVAEAAAKLGRTPKSVQNYINLGLLAVCPVGGGTHKVFLLRAKDVAAFDPPARGRPVEKPARKKRDKK